MKDNLYTLFYALILGVVCATILTAASTYCKPRQEANAEAEKTWNILNVLGVDFDKKSTAQDLLKLADEVVTEKTADNLTLYEYRESGNLVSANPLIFEEFRKIVARNAP